MPKLKKILLWGLGSFFGLLFALLLLVPYFIDSTSLKQKIQIAVSRKNIGQLDYGQAYLALLPFPHLTIKKLDLAVPGHGVVKVAALEIYPELIPLLGGQILLSKICLDTPEVKLVFPENPAKKQVVEKDRIALNLSDRLAVIIAPLAIYTSNMEVTIEQGRIDLAGGLRPGLLIRDLCLDADLAVIGPRFFQAKLNLATFGLTLNRAGKNVRIDCEKLKANFKIDGDKAIFSLTDLTLSRPALSLSGQFIADPKASGFSFDLKGKDLDVDMIRTAALDLGGDNATVKDIFAYVQGGRIPDISVQSKSKRLAGLGELDNIVIRGRMENGDIAIDNIGLKMTAVDGDALIFRGILKASNLSAKMGKAYGRDGSLKVGLTSDNDVFHLEFMLNTRLAQVPETLKNIISNEAFVHELSNIGNLKGSGKARLVLGEHLNSVTAQVDISELRLSADYRRIPFPVEIDSGQLFFSKNMIKIKKMSGRVGNSLFSEIFCQLQWQKSIFINIPSGNLDFDLGEFYPWISSFAPGPQDMAAVKGVKGHLIFSMLKLKIPHDKPDQWQLTGTGEVRKVRIDTTLLPGELYLSSGKIQISPNRFSWQKLKTRLLDADFELSGTLSGSFSHPESVDVSVNGKLGAKAAFFAQQQLHLPADYAVDAPLQFTNVLIAWQPMDDFSFKGYVAFPKGARVFSDFRYRPDDLTIKRLSIRDQDSKAAFTFVLQKDIVNFKFNGYLRGKTLKRIFVAEKLSNTWLNGDLQVFFVRGRPRRSIAAGKLEGGGLLLPVQGWDDPVIDKFALAARKNRLIVNRLILSQKMNRVDLKGRIDLTADGFDLDLDASAGALKWRSFTEKPVKPIDVRQDKSKKSFWHYPVSGAIHLAAESFTWEDYTWKPFYAEISIIKDGVNIEVRDSRLCGINSFGTLQIKGDELSMDFQFTAKNQDIAPGYACLTQDRIQMTGLFDLTAQIKAYGQSDQLLHSAHGYFKFKAKNGRITRDKKLSRILEALNVVEIVKGHLPDLKSKGFNYKKINIQGEFADDMMVFTKLYMDGKTLDLVGQGSLDLKEKKLDVELLALVGLFKTVNSIIKYIPGEKYLMVGNLVSIPVNLKGDIADPRVSIMSLSAVSSNFLDFAERLIKSPFRLLESVLPGKKKK